MWSLCLYLLYHVGVAFIHVYGYESDFLFTNRVLLEPSDLHVLDYGRNYITLAWTPASMDLLDHPARSFSTVGDGNGGDSPFVLYQVWYWPINDAMELVMSTTSGTSFTILQLVSGQSYSVWVLGMAQNVTSDYVTLMQTTGTYITPSWYHTRKI